VAEQLTGDPFAQTNGEKQLLKRINKTCYQAARLFSLVAERSGSLVAYARVRALHIHKKGVLR
jgi:hypothetical protein